jgi:16S rRNA (guanine1207-N2)-methyltransferase
MTQQKPATMDVAVVNLLYQPGKAWMLYALSVAAFALRVGGRFYATGAKDRGILTLAKRMQEFFGNVETLEISKGHRVLCSTKRADIPQEQYPATSLTVFADNKLDDGTRMLLDALEGQEFSPAMQALDLGCGAGFIGVYLARRAVQGHVTMVDTSLAAVAASQQTIQDAGLASSATVLASDGVQAVREQQFDVVATNPPFHQGGIQTREIAERFISDAAQVLVPQGKLFLVANRFLKYEPTMQDCFSFVREIYGDSRYKVLCASVPQK